MKKIFWFILQLNFFNKNIFYLCKRGLFVVSSMPNGGNVFFSCVREAIVFVVGSMPNGGQVFIILISQLS